MLRCGMRFRPLLPCLCAAALAAGCTRVSPAGPPARKPPLFSDTFDRAELGPDYRATGPFYRIVNGELVVKGAHNHPAWLLRELPADAVIEFDARSQDPAGDIKVEAWGDGKSHATQASYTSTGYVFILGGWQNHITALCRMDEHGEDRKARQDMPVQMGRTYHFVIARRGGHIDWFVDNQLVHTMDDPSPLGGPGHSSFAFNNWEAELHFDNLVVRPY